jgi:hypothetical protein
VLVLVLVVVVVVVVVVPEPLRNWPVFGRSRHHIWCASFGVP